MQIIKNYKFTIIFIILLIVLSVLCWRNSNKTIEQDDPQEITQKFIQADMLGARLGFQFSQNTPNIFSYTSWQGAPGYDEWMIIKDYIIKQTKIQKNNAEVEVEFICLAGSLQYNTEGEIIGIEKCKLDSEIIVFYLEKNNNQWKITSPHIIPHISKDTALKFFELNNIDLSILNGYENFKNN